MNNTLLGLLLAWALPALAHEGHGLDGPHGHATDIAGLCITLVVIAAFWWSGRK
jgi:hypothetical protein